MNKLFHTLALACSLMAFAGHATAGTIPKVENAIITGENANDACVLLLGTSSEADVPVLTVMEAMTADTASKRCGQISGDRLAFDI